MRTLPLLYTAMNCEEDHIGRNVTGMTCLTVCQMELSKQIPKEIVCDDLCIIKLGHNLAMDYYKHELMQPTRYTNLCITNILLNFYYMFRPSQSPSWIPVNARERYCYGPPNSTKSLEFLEQLSNS